MSDQGAIAKIGILGNKGLTKNAGIEVPVDDTMSRKIVIPKTAGMSDGHCGKGWNIDRCSGTIAANIV